MIPKIIHFTAPKEKENWHPLWHHCFQSWKDHFNSDEFEIVLWNHEEIDNFIHNNFSEEWKTYKDIPFHIMKLDFFRYGLLTKYGGIYSDIDIYCYKNFYDTLKKDSYLMESWGNKYAQNSLMISTPNNIFFGECIKESMTKYNKVREKLNVTSIKHPYYNLFVRSTFGGIFLSSKFKKYLDANNIYTPSLLPKEIYNPHSFKYSEDYVTKHMLTGMWGKESLELAKSAGFQKAYKQQRSLDVNLENFDFKKNYF